MPEIELELRPGGQVRVQTTRPGEANVTWQEVGSSATYDEEDTVDVYVSGTVVISGTTVRFQPTTG